MTQLKDDCFAHGDDLTPLDLALEQLQKTVEAVVGTEEVPLSAALARILGQDVKAERNVPPHDNSAVDGYAVIHQDLMPDADTSLPIGGRITAGHKLDDVAKPGQAYRIFTGAPMPAGADTVFMQEDVRLDGDDVILPAGIKAGANRRFKGEDVQAGSVILSRGKRLRPQEIGLAASVGRSKLTVYKRLRVAVFSTGDEVRDPGGEAPEGCIFDANRFTIMGLLERLGCLVTDLGILEDDETVIADALSAAAGDHDLLFTSGGVSVGDEDHIKPAVEKLGSLHFWRLAIKPGRPIAFGQVAGTPFVGLPGNPVAAMVTFMCIARVLVLRLSGALDVAAPTYKVRAAFSFKGKGERREWLRARLEKNADGDFCAHLYPATGSGVLTSMVASDGLVEVGEEQTRIEEGELVDFLPFPEMCP
ncbi:MAG: molybdopterin molybdotransferase MoeA [Rhodospirillaceae bacterium]|jgi:molybdopterin molybdotransferase|nr:molybdopterin molybdotransferase MoeA [Rhodospirillaceae bacterium]MBT5243579.1 molybdopterin molybdotransferase MoeA [Rhodospirillaceae bacterium]MBT5562167.1 molybdopterin molybdotransferase MoeA [Rhodospirillaceae bacterium]MBT6242340.1 molybdopterin molybdotransferase MoeA [Rhodospirillaceae bacterium]MBT7138954.1 molybdopterin molybdotransferase MoeA [Rhodospirillaceae bacterium]